MNTWKPLESWELSQLNLPNSGKVYALLDEAGEVTMAGHLLVQGSDNHWLIEPVSGYPQWMSGVVAEGGVVPKALYDNFVTFAPRAERLEVVDSLIGTLPPVQGLGYFMLFKKCAKCGGYKVKRVFVESQDEFLTDDGIYYVDAAADALTSFLRPQNGICIMC